MLRSIETCTVHQNSVIHTRSLENWKLHKQKVFCFGGIVCQIFFSLLSNLLPYCSPPSPALSLFLFSILYLINTVHGWTESENMWSKMWRNDNQLAKRKKMISSKWAKLSFIRRCFNWTALFKTFQDQPSIWTENKSWIQFDSVQLLHSSVKDLSKGGWGSHATMAWVHSCVIVVTSSRGCSFASRQWCQNWLIACTKWDPFYAGRSKCKTNVMKQRCYS